MFLWLLLLGGGGFLAYRHYHQGHPVTRTALPPSSQLALTLGEAQVANLATELRDLLAKTEPGKTSPEAVAVLKRPEVRTSADRQAVADAARRAGANERSATTTLLAAELE